MVDIAPFRALRPSIQNDVSDLLTLGIRGVFKGFCGTLDPLQRADCANLVSGIRSSLRKVVFCRNPPGDVVEEAVADLMRRPRESDL